MRRWRLGGWVVWLWLVSASVAWGNMSKPWVDGDPLTEPLGVFKQLHILSESLVLDFRSLDDDGRLVVGIKATYRIEQRGPAAMVPLFFAAPGLKQGSVSLDGNALKGKITERMVPKQWRVRKTKYKTKGMLFRARLTPGKHVLSVAYRAAPIVRLRGPDVRRYGIGYVLGPAKTWASFGGLTIAAHLPKGWEVLENSLKLKRDGDVLRGAFQTIPADVMLLRVKPPSGLLPLKVPFIIAFFVVLFVLLVWILWRQGRDIFNGEREARIMWIRSVATAIALPGIFGILSWGFLWLLLEWVQSHPHAALLGYDNLLWFALGVVILPVVLLLLSVAVFLLHRSRMPAPR